uniref:Uncharacterized protein n=1 Tax=Chromera velia CCMP2878 TaxID=1169474 RepID=A0A0G4HFG0_9ALVE|eukprot:Cvel_991.t1-p1 / transcript=Cvel_991.t1 / gene=Cvel_991 / organism=Chromera_velia_CCMP2878 / gene_product=hypothetical protein / transcript_product=hypothetical protein / location=Cvel_scaffold32:68099-68725(-) / protein_length=209 / sequence_SO=supercontig / SO=protein_coding / is_pseudo=false
MRQSLNDTRPPSFVQVAAAVGDTLSCIAHSSSWRSRYSVSHQDFGDGWKSDPNLTTLCAHMKVPLPPPLIWMPPPEVTTAATASSAPLPDSKKPKIQEEGSLLSREGDSPSAFPASVLSLLRPSKTDPKKKLRRRRIHQQPPSSYKRVPAEYRRRFDPLTTLSIVPAAAIAAAAAGSGGVQLDPLFLSDPSPGGILEPGEEIGRRANFF